MFNKNNKKLKIFAFLSLFSKIKINNVNKKSQTVKKDIYLSLFYISKDGLNTEPQHQVKILD